MLVIVNEGAHPSQMAQVERSPVIIHTVSLGLTVQFSSQFLPDHGFLL